MSNDYGDWFLDNFDYNLDYYVEEKYPNKEAKQEQEKERIVAIYHDSYEQDKDFEEWCLNEAVSKEEMAYDEWIDSQIDELREERRENDKV